MIHSNINSNIILASACVCLTSVVRVTMWITCRVLKHPLFYLFAYLLYCFKSSGKVSFLIMPIVIINNLLVLMSPAYALRLMKIPEYRHDYFFEQTKRTKNLMNKNSEIANKYPSNKLKMYCEDQMVKELFVFKIVIILIKKSKISAKSFSN